MTRNGRAPRTDTIDHIGVTTMRVPSDEEAEAFVTAYQFSATYLRMVFECEGQLVGPEDNDAAFMLRALIDLGNERQRQGRGLQPEAEEALDIWRDYVKSRRPLAAPLPEGKNNAGPVGDQAAASPAAVIPVGPTRERKKNNPVLDDLVKVLSSYVKYVLHPTLGRYAPEIQELVHVKQEADEARVGHLVERLIKLADQATSLADSLRSRGGPHDTSAGEPYERKLVPLDVIDDAGNIDTGRLPDVRHEVFATFLWDKHPDIDILRTAGHALGIKGLRLAENWFVSIYDQLKTEPARVSTSDQVLYPLLRMFCDFLVERPRILRRKCYLRRDLKPWTKKRAKDRR